MDNAIRQWIKKEVNIGKARLTVLDILFILGVSLAGLLMRYSMKGFEGADYTLFIGPWMEKIQELGGIRSLGVEVGNYPPLYMYVFTLLSYLPCSYLTSVKAFFCLCDYVLAFGCALLVYEGRKSKTMALSMYALILMLPTVAADSALWAQVDSSYAAPLIFSMYFIAKDKPVKSFLFYGLAFALKLQCLFLMPLYIVLWVKKKNMKIWHFLLIPLTYFVSVIPAWIAGRSLKDLLLIYFNHYGEYTQILSMNRPNAYFLTVVDMLQEYIGGAGMWFTFGLLIFLMFYMAAKKITPDVEFMIHAGLLILMVVTFFLPYMHERYGYVADLLAVAYGLYNVKKFYVPILAVACSLGGYVGFVTGTFPIPYVVLALGFLYAMYEVAKDFYYKYGTSQKETVDA